MAIWNITEKKDELLEFVGEHLHDPKSNKDNLHWLASRVLIKHIYANHKIEILKDEFNKPSLKVDGENYHISITHSFEFAAIIISKSKIVAIDMERFDERIQRVKHKFTRDDEFVYLDENDESKMLTTIWSAKETLYKFYGKKELDFKLHLKIEAFVFQSRYQLVGWIRKGNFNQKFDIQVEDLNGYVLTFIC